MSTPNISQLNQTDSTAPSNESENINCKINLKNINEQMLQQIKQTRVSQKKKHKSSLTNKLLKELHKQKERFIKFKIENNLLKKYLFKCCCAKKCCRKTTIKMSRKNKYAKRTNDNNFISIENISTPKYKQDIPKLDQISILNEKLIKADQKSSNFVIVSPIETNAPTKVDVKTAQNIPISTKSESLFSLSTKYSKSQSVKYSSQKAPLNCMTKTIEIKNEINKEDSFISSQKKNLKRKNNTVHEDAGKNKIECLKSKEKINKVCSSQEKKSKCELGTETDDKNNKTADKSEKRLILTKNNIIVKDVRNNNIETLISIDKIIEEANKKIKDKKDVWFEKKINKCNDLKVNENYIEVDYRNKTKERNDKPKIITSTQELIKEKELNLVIKKDKNTDSNFSFKDINPKLIKRKSNNGKKKTNDLKKLDEIEDNKKPNILVKNDIKITTPKISQENMEHEFLKPMTPDIKTKKKSKKHGDTMNTLIEQSNKEMQQQNESAKMASLIDISNDEVESKKLKDISKRIELWKEFGSPWINDFMDLSMQYTFPKADEVIFEDSSFGEADGVKPKENQVIKFLNQSTQTLWQSPNLSPIPKI